MKRFLAKDSRDLGRSSIRGDMKLIMGLTRFLMDTDLDVPQWLQVHDLDNLKSKLIGVVVAIVAVVFVGVFVDSNRASDVISYGVGVDMTIGFVASNY